MKSKCGQFFQYLQLCTSEWDKDERSCVPDVSVFTCSLWERPDHVMENHVSEMSYGVRSTQGEGHNAALRKKGTGPKGMDFFRVHYGHTKGRPLWNSRHYQVLVKLWMRDWWSVYSLRKKIKQSSCLSSHFFQIIISRTMQPYNALTIKTYCPTFVEQLKLH